MQLVRAHLVFKEGEAGLGAADLLLIKSQAVVTIRADAA